MENIVFGTHEDGLEGAIKEDIYRRILTGHFYTVIALIVMGTKRAIEIKPLNFEIGNNYREATTILKIMK